jgi:hypothetical protein
MCLDKNHARATKTSISGMKSTLMTDPSPSTNFNINELESDLKSVKPGTTDNLEGVYIRGSSVIVVKERKNGWYHSWMMSNRQPDCQNYSNGQGCRYSKTKQRWFWSCALSTYFVAEYDVQIRLILQRIQPLIEAATPVHLAGFRKHRYLYWTGDDANYTHWTRFPALTKDWSSIRWPVHSIWHCVEGRTYILKLMRTVPCAKISNQVFLGKQSSRWCRLKNS